MRHIAAVLLLITVSFAKDWQVGKVEVYPTVVKGALADYPGHTYTNSQTGYVCTDGDADSAPFCTNSMRVDTPGYARITLEDGAQFIVPVYYMTPYTPETNVSDDLNCLHNIRPSYGDRFLTSGYSCTVFKRLVLSIEVTPTLVTRSTQPIQPDVHTFKYRLKQLHDGREEIRIEKLGKGEFTRTSLPPAVSPSVPAQRSAPGAPSGNGAVGQDAAARKQFAEKVKQVSIQKLGSQIAPGFNITADGPDATIYVFHVGAGMTYAACYGDDTNKESYMAALRKVGFTQYVCTDDGNTRLTLDITATESQRPDPSPSNQGQLGYEKERTPDATASPEKATQTQSQPLAKPTPGSANTAHLIAQQQSQPNSSASGALIVKPERPEPFGFHVGMTQQEAIAAVGHAAVKAGYPKPEAYGSFLMLSTAPKPNSSFDSYLLKFSAEGLFELWAHTPGIHSANNGAQVRDEFNDLRKLIAGKYGEPQCVDYRDAGTSDRPDFFMLYLKDKEQHLFCAWDVGQTTILLEAESLDIDTAIVGVKYQFIPEFERSKAGADKKRADSF